MSDNMKSPEEEAAELKKCLEHIQHKIIVMSGKGGVGKSTVAVNLAVALSMEGKRVGLLDVDIHGPSVPTMLNLAQERPASSGGKMLPVNLGKLKVMSIGFLLREQDDAVIWRGPMKMGVIKQFLTEVEWGELDYLIIDSPPGTGDEPLSVCQLIEDADGAVVVTTPQEVSAADVRKSVDFCDKLNLSILGVFENMSGFVCPECGKITDIFSQGAGKAITDKFGLRLLGKIPLDPQICNAGDSGRPFIYHFSDTATAKIFTEAIVPLLELPNKDDKENTPKTVESIFKIAIPCAEGKLCSHFGHCEKFLIADVDSKANKIVKTELLPPPAHEPGVLPKWLKGKGVTQIIAGGMGQLAQQFFEEAGIHVTTGAPAIEPELVIKDFLAGKLVTGNNSCEN